MLQCQKQKKIQKPKTQCTSIILYTPSGKCAELLLHQIRSPPMAMVARVSLGISSGIPTT